MDQYRSCVNQKFKHANKARCLSFKSGRVRMMVKMYEGTCGVWSFGMAPARGWLITGLVLHPIIIHSTRLSTILIIKYASISQSQFEILSLDTTLLLKFKHSIF